MVIVANKIDLQKESVVDRYANEDNYYCIFAFTVIGQFACNFYFENDVI